MTSNDKPAIPPPVFDFTTEYKQRPDIWLDFSSAGSGKTTGILRLIKESFEGPKDAVWVLAQPTAELLTETWNKLTELGLPSDVLIERVDGVTCCAGLVGETIKRRLREVTGTAVFLITHAGLKYLTGADFQNGKVSLVIDEMPEFFTFKKMIGKTKKLCEGLCYFKNVRSGVSQVSLNTDGDAWLALPVEHGDNSSDSIQSLLKWIQNSRSPVLFAHKHLVSLALDPKIFKQASKTYLLTATPESAFFREYCDENGLIIDYLQINPDYTYFKDPEYRFAFGPYSYAYGLPPNVSIKICYLYDETSPLSKVSLIPANQKKLGTKLKNLFASGVLKSRKERCIVILNRETETLVQAGNLTELKDKGQVITPGTAGLNSLKDCDTIVYLAAVNADRDVFTSFKSIFKSDPDFTYFQRRTAANSMYQAVLRSQLRDTRYGTAADIVLVVFGKYEAEIMRDLVIGGEAKKEVEVKPATSKMFRYYPKVSDSKVSKPSKS